MFKILAVSVFSAALLCACNKSNNSGGGPGIVNGTGIGKLGDLNRAEYKSEACTAIVSGSENPAQVILGLTCRICDTCNSTIEHDFILACGAGDHKCSADYADGTHADAAFAENYAQFVFLKFFKDGSREISQSFTCTNCTH
jgi:hypothetical protein